MLIPRQIVRNNDAQKFEGRWSFHFIIVNEELFNGLLFQIIFEASFLPPTNCDPHLRGWNSPPWFCKIFFFVIFFYCILKSFFPDFPPALLFCQHGEKIVFSRYNNSLYSFSCLKFNTKQSKLWNNKNYPEKTRSVCENCSGLRFEPGQWCQPWERIAEYILRSIMAMMTNLSSLSLAQWYFLKIDQQK
jgi:hypothetical protein